MACESHMYNLTFTSSLHRHAVNTSKPARDVTGRWHPAPNHTREFSRSRSFHAVPLASGQEHTAFAPTKDGGQQRADRRRPVESATHAHPSKKSTGGNYHALTGQTVATPAQLPVHQRPAGQHLVSRTRGSRLQAPPRGEVKRNQPTPRSSSPPVGHDRDAQQ